MGEKCDINALQWLGSKHILQYAPSHPASTAWSSQMTLASYRARIDDTAHIRRWTAFPVLSSSSSLALQTSQGNADCSSTSVP